MGFPFARDFPLQGISVYKELSFTRDFPLQGISLYKGLHLRLPDWTSQISPLLASPPLSSSPGLKGVRANTPNESAAQCSATQNSGAGAFFSLSGQLKIAGAGAMNVYAVGGAPGSRKDTHLPAASWLSR